MGHFLPHFSLLQHLWVLLMVVSMPKTNSSPFSCLYPHQAPAADADDGARPLHFPHRYNLSPNFGAAPHKPQLELVENQRFPG